MKCAYHYDRNAVATCKVCGKGLCQECADLISPPQCVGCFKNNLEAEKSKVVKSLVCAGVLALVIFFGGVLGPNGNIVEAFFWACVPFGWIALNRITPNIFLIMPVGGWIVYFLIKLVLSMVVGIVALPYKLIKDMLYIKKINAQLAQARQLEQ